MSWFQGNTRRDWECMDRFVYINCLNSPGSLVPALAAAARCTGTEHLKTWLEQQWALVEQVHSLGSP